MKLEEFVNLSVRQQQSILDDADFPRVMQKWIVRLGLIFVFIIILGMWGCPQYNVWHQKLEGEAELAKASQNRQIAVNEAQALKEAAQFKADAEVLRAGGVARANKIIADGLGGPEGYLRYIYIDALKDTKCSTVYVPTEAGLPILEAARPFYKQQ